MVGGRRVEGVNASFMQEGGWWRPAGMTALSPRKYK